MKKAIFIFIIIFILGLAAGCASKSSSSGNPVITIVNNTGYVVLYLQISPVTDNTWGNDMLGPEQIIHNGQSVSISLPFPLSVSDRYDIRLISNDGDIYRKMNVTVTPGSELVFSIDDLVIR